MNNFTFGRLLGGAALAVLAAPFSPVALAQQSESTTSYLDTIIVTANRREQPISDVQASVEVITSQQMERFSGASVTEVLRQSVGIDARTSGANSRVSVRGQIPGSGNAVLILYDGLPRTGKYGTPNLNLYPFEDVERIEIIRGPMSALYGANASGGVINVITKDAGTGDPLSVRVTAGSAFGGSGEGRETAAIGGTANVMTGEVGHRISLDWRSSDPFRFDGEIEDELSGIDHTSLTYTGLMKTGETGELGWSLEGYWQDDSSLSADRTGTTYDRYEREDRYFGALQYDVELGGGLLELEGSYGYSDGVTNRSHPGPDETTEFTQSLLQGRFSKDLGSHSLLFGAGAQQEEIELTILSETGEETNLFAFVQDEWKINDALKLNAGVRVDDFEGFGTQVVPRVSVGSRGDGFTWRFGYGEAYSAPGVIQQYGSFVRGGRLIIVGSPDVEAEETTTWEGAIGWRGTRGVVELVYHDSDITNLIQSFNTREFDENRYLVFRYANIAEAEISGVELSGSYEVGAGLTVDGAYEYIDALDAMTGERLTGRAEQVFRAGVSWANGPFQANLRARHFDSVWGADPSQRGSAPFSSDYTVADIQLGYDFSEKLGISVGIENVFDELTPVNWDRTGQIEDPAGRYAYVSLRYAFGDQGD